jgi:hypothetical protein
MPSQYWKVMVAAALLVAAEARGAPAAGQGRVAFVTDKRAYLDHGADGGLTAGQTVALFRGGRPAGSCTVEAIAAHRASCLGGRPRAGDTFRLGRPLAASQPAQARPLPPVVAVEDLEADAQAIASAGVDKVDFAGRAHFGSGQALALTGGYASWTAGTDPQSDFRQERLDGSLRVRLGQSGLRLDAAFSALRWHPRPERTRFRPGAETQFFLWEAELSRRDPDARTVVAVGRLWPWHAPGLSVLDGVQIGRQNQARTVEWGAYGGLVPDPLTLAPDTGAWAGGLYGSLTQAGTKADLVRLAREEARAGARQVPGTGLVTETELLAQLWLGSSAVGAGGRAIYLPGSHSSALDRGYLELRIQAGRVSGGLHLRYFGAALDAGEAVLQNVSPSLTGGYHAAGDASWDPLPWLGAGLFADVSRDADSGWSGRDGAVELRLPRLFGDLGGLWLGAEAAEGWLRSRTLYAQVLGRVRDRFRLLARVSASASEFSTAEPNPNTRELDAYLQLDASVGSWLHLRGRSLIRAPLAEDERELGPGLVLGLDATGTF